MFDELHSIINDIRSYLDDRLSRVPTYDDGTFKRGIYYGSIGKLTIYDQWYAELHVDGDTYERFRSSNHKALRSYKPKKVYLKHDPSGIELLKDINLTNAYLCVPDLYLKPYDVDVSQLNDSVEDMLNDHLEQFIDEYVYSHGYKNGCLRVNLKLPISFGTYIDPFILNLCSDYDLIKEHRYKYEVLSVKHTNDGPMINVAIKEIF